MKRFLLVLIIFLIIGLLAGCKATSPQKQDATDEKVPIEIVYNFDNGDEGWRGDFADVPIVTEGTDYNLAFAHADIPVAGQESKGLMLSGNNIGKSIFIYAYKKLDTQSNVIENSNYTVDISVDMATNVPNNAGAPAEDVFIKAGLVSEMPKLNLENDIKKLNLDKGGLGVDNDNFIAMGNLGKINSDDTTYQYKNLENTFEITTANNTDFSLIIGVEAETPEKIKIYIDNVKLKFVKQQ